MLHGHPLLVILVKIAQLPHIQHFLYLVIASSQSRVMFLQLAIASSQSRVMNRYLA